MLSLEEITLKNSTGMELTVINYGATMTSLKVPDKNCIPVNVIVSLETTNNYNEKPYTDSLLYLGCTVGRYAGRISNGGFIINNKEYKVFNENGVHLHGGKEGFDKKYWKVEEVNKAENPFVKLSYLSKHLEEGYPGNLNVTVTYQLTENNELIIKYQATTDAVTPINLTNHSYFNLNGKGSILNHSLHLNSDSYLNMNEHLIPSGKIIDSKNTRFDFTTNSKIGRDDFKELDDVFIVNDNPVKATLKSKETGIKMEVRTNQPAIVIYTPKQFPELPFKDTASYSKFSAICFETQNFPDAPNQPNFPSSLLKPDEKYLNESIFKFTVE